MQEFGAFKVLASAFFQGSEKEYADQTEWIRSRIAFLNAAQQSEVKALLDELLSGNYSDDQLHVIWKEGKSCYLFPGKNLRVFLAVVRDAIDF